MTTAVGAVEPADLNLIFKNSDQGVKTLIKGEPSAFMSGIQNGSIKMEGDFSLLVWFSKAARLLPPQFLKTLELQVKKAKGLWCKKFGK